MNNSVNRLNTDVELTSKIGHCVIAVGIEQSDLSNLVGGQFGIARTFAPGRPPIGSHVRQVFSLGAPFQMRWSDARWRIAAMHDDAIDLTQQQIVFDGVCQSMNQDWSKLATEVELAVTIAPQPVAGPQPAACFDVADRANVEPLKQPIIHGSFIPEDSPMSQIPRSRSNGGEG
jgi:hypothetical protein